MNSPWEAPKTWWDITDCKLCCNDKWKGFVLCDFHLICKSDDPIVRQRALEYKEEQKRQQEIKDEEIKKEKEKVRLLRHQEYLKEELVAYKLRIYKRFLAVCFPVIDVTQPYICRGFRRTVYQSSIDELEDLEAENYQLYGSTLGHYQKKHRIKCICKDSLYGIVRLETPCRRMEETDAARRRCVKKSWRMDKLLIKVNNGPKKTYR